MALIAIMNNVYTVKRSTNDLYWTYWSGLVLIKTNINNHKMLCHNKTFMAIYFLPRKSMMNRMQQNAHNILEPCNTVYVIGYGWLMIVKPKESLL